MNLPGVLRGILIGVTANASLGASALPAATVIVPDDDPSVVHAAANAAPGDVIQIRAGVYAEGKAIVIRQSGVQVVGLGGLPVITGGNGRGGFWVRGASDVLIGGLEVRGKGKAVRLDDCTSCAVVGVVVTECGQGVRVRGGSGNFVVGSVFSDVWRRDGVLLDHSPFGFVGGNNMTRVRARGIRLNGSGGAQVFDNTVQDAQWGIRIDHSEESRLERNTVSGAGSDGFRVSWSDGVRMSGNDASGSGGKGFRVAYSRRAALDGNSATANADGFELTRGDEAVLNGNGAFANRGDGFYLRGDRTVVSGNTAADNQDSGFDVSGRSLDIRQNAATDNRRYGFDVSSSAPDLTEADLSNAANTANGNGVDFRVD